MEYGIKKILFLNYDTHSYPPALVILLFKRADINGYYLPATAGNAYRMATCRSMGSHQPAKQQG
jgi:hypothetical protein